MKLLLTGCTGFLGSALCKTLLQFGHQVVGIGRKKYGFLTPEILENKNFHFLSLELKNITKADLEGFGFDACIHLASMVEYASHDYHDYHDYTIIPVLNLISLAQELKIPKVIFSSTLSVIGKAQSKDQKVNEDSCVNPMSNYGLSKYLCEKLFEIATLKNPDFSCIALRFPAIFGKNHLGGLVHTLKENAIKNEEIELFGKGQYLRNILYVDDAIKAILLSLEADLKGYELFVIGSEKSISVLEIAQELIRLTHSQSQIILSDKQSPNPFDAKIDISKAQDKLGFEPMPLSSSLQSYIQSLKEER